MFKRIFILAKDIIFYPAKAWKGINEAGYHGDVQRSYLLPFILTGSLASVGGYLINNSFDIQNVIKILAITFLSAYIGFFMAAYLIKLFIQKMYDKNIYWRKMFHFTAYSYTVILVVNIIVGLIPVDAFFLKIFNFYTVYIVLQGAYTLDIQENEQSRFAIVATAIILLCPIIVNFLMNLTMPGMKV